MMNNRIVSKIVVGAGGTLGLLAVPIVFGLIFSYFIMLLWNACLVPAVQGVNEIGFLQAWGLSILSVLLFKIQVKPNL